MLQLKSQEMTVNPESMKKNENKPAGSDCHVSKQASSDCHVSFGAEPKKRRRSSLFKVLN